MSFPPEASFWTLLLKIIEEKSAGTVTLFDRGDFYCAYSSDAFLVAKEIFRSQSVLKSCNNHRDAKVSYVIINRNQYQRVIRELILVRQYRVELYRQKNDKRDVDWDLVAKGSPGNLIDFEDVLSEAEEFVNNGTVLALKISSDASNRAAKTVAIAACDIQTSLFSVAELADSPHLSNLEAVLVNFGPRECVIPEDKSEDNAILEGVLKRADILVSSRKKSDFSYSDIIQDLNNLLKFKKNEIHNSAQLDEVNMTEAMSCLGALIKYLGLLSDKTNWGSFHLDTFHLGRFLRLDPSAVTALELFSTSYSGGRDGTLFSLLNKCKTVSGQRLLAQWIRQPLRDVRQIEERLDVVQALVSNSGIRYLLSQDFLNKVPDLLRLTKRLVRKKANLQDCYKVYQLIQSLPKLSETLIGLVELDEGSAAAVREMFLEPLQHATEVFRKFLLLIEGMVDLGYFEKCFAFRVKPECDENLSEFASEIDENHKQMEKEQKRASGTLGLDSLKLENNAQLGFFFRVTRKDEKLLRNNKDFKILDTQKGGVRFTTAQLECLNEKYLELKNSYDETQEDIVARIVEVAAGYADPLKSLSQTVGVLDVLTAFAVVSASASPQYTRPVFLAQGARMIELEECRHPCLEEQEGVSFIPNGLHLQEGETQLLIVTGPNMGGKSTYLRQTGLSVLMAQMGCFLPCRSAKISPVDGIFTRVGACDHQTKGLSTFMVEMLESAAIIEAATANSLIIVDELGRGTSTYDGFGLAWAIAQHIATKLNSFCLFATHFHELTELSAEVRTVKNVKVTGTVEGGEFTLLYRVESGVANQSYGIQVADLLTFPKHVVQNAAEKLRLLEKSTAVRDNQLKRKEKQIAKVKDLVSMEHVVASALRNILNEFDDL